ncbi:site-2 protease family protein [Rummeliibacillus sp. NPDC094406]|uniref:site-2 protease family protein n=1 Tax=Rummeliibacillus sp. NPDC094406 TaxID=3364511 RepID=UPI00382F3A57
MGKLKLHPTLLPLIVWLIITGQFSNYALLFISLCWHECGHLVAAYILGVKVKSCIIMPYGGEILYETKWQITKSQQFKIAIAGPIATLLLFGIAFFFPGNLSGPLQTIQVLLLLINLLPIWPLDGGRILEIVWSEKKSLQATKTSFLLLSMSCCLTCFILAIWYIPRSMFFMLILILLFYQNIKAFRYRKYEQAFENVVLNRLTS